MKSITENTKISISILILILGGYGYVMTISAATSANTRDIEKLQVKQESLEQIDRDIVEMKTDLRWIKKRLDPEQAGKATNQ